MAQRDTSCREGPGDEPLILLFSRRRRIRDIIAVGLLQCRYRVIRASTPHVAILRAAQFVPDLVILDITEKNLRDILIVNRLHRAERTRRTAFLAVVPPGAAGTIEQIRKKREPTGGGGAEGNIELVRFPFRFAELLKKVRTLVGRTEGVDIEGVGEKEDPRSVNEHIARSLFDGDIPVETKLQRIASVLHKQWAFPHTVIKALDIIGSEASCCDELARCIRSDMSASAAVLRVANTVYYAKRHGKVSDIREAIVRIGFSETRNLLSCFALIDLSSRVYTKSGFSRIDFWFHSLGTALIAEKLCADAGFGRPELAFLAGLIHDLGKIPLDNSFEHVFPSLLEKCSGEVISFDAAEGALMNFTHADLGHYLTGEWNFPSVISSAILNHHRPERILRTTPLAERIVQEAVFTANQLAKAVNIGHSCDEILREAPKRMLERFNIPAGPGDAFFTSVFRRLHLFERYLDIPPREFTLSRPRAGTVPGDILFAHGRHAPFHPLLRALHHQGYTVRVVKQLPSDHSSDFGAAIIMPEPGRPLDIVLYDDGEGEEEGTPALKIFLTDAGSEEMPEQNLAGGRTVFIDSRRLDVRVVLHALDTFFGQVPETERMGPEAPESDREE